MPRSRRRRVNDRRREAEQRRLAQETFQRAREAEGHLNRGVKAVLRAHAGEVMETRDGRAYLIEDDGSARRLKEGGVL